ncbi:MAG: hypothetical protein ABI210_12855, partial [Abditibacteriaceae bacterium]
MLMLKKSILIAICFFCVNAAQNVVQAQSLWATINQNELQVKLSEQPEKPSIAFDKVKDSIVTADGKTLTFNPQDDKPYLTATLPPNTNLIGVSNEWGVIKSNEPDGGEYQLHYYAKAARTLKDAANPVDMNAQWYVRYQYGAPPGAYWDGGDKASVPIVARLVEDGRTVAHAQVKIYNPQNQQYNFRHKSYNAFYRYEQASTDADGKVLFYAEGDGDYKLQASWTRPVSSHQGKSYSSIRNYSTITIHIRVIDIEGFDPSAKVSVGKNEDKLFHSHAFSLRFSADSKKLITIGPIAKGDDEYFPTITDKRLRVWDATSGNEIWRLPAQPYTPTRLDNYWGRNTSIVMPDFKTMYTSQWNVDGFTEVEIHSFHWWIQLSSATYILFVT